MTRIVIIAWIACSMFAVAPAMAQTESGGGRRVLGTVVNGNTTIEFEAANESDLDVKQLQTWSDFAASHPKIASALASNPRLISNDGYVNKHAELAKLFADNPGLRDSMDENPGNYVVPTQSSE